MKIDTWVCENRITSSWRPRYTSACLRMVQDARCEDIASAVLILIDRQTSVGREGIGKMYEGFLRMSSSRVGTNGQEWRDRRVLQRVQINAAGSGGEEDWTLDVCDL
jgi:hypothetical protein